MIACPFCSSSIHVPVDRLKESVQEIKPASASETASRPPLALRRNVAVSGAPQCPACNAVLDEGVVVCIRCGFDFRTGKRFNTRMRRQWWTRRRVLTALLMLCAAGGAVVWMRERGGLGQKDVVQMARTLAHPRPAVGCAAVIELAGQVRSATASNLDLAVPVHAEGQQVELRLTNGVVVRGKFNRVRGQSVLLESGGVTNRHRLCALDAYTRLSCDKEFREAWLSGEALVMARDDLSKRGYSLPEQALDSMDALTNAAAIGDPCAFRMCGSMYFRGSGFPKDVDYAFLYTRLSALQGMPEAQYDLGLFYLAGIAVPHDLDEGLKWMGRAADQKFQPAEDFMSAKKQNDEATARVCRSCLGIGKITCPDCRGFGHFDVKTQDATCEQCQGTGKFKKRLASKMSQFVPCAFCNGTGKATKTVKTPCATCKQTGLVDCPRCHAASGGKPAESTTNWVESASDWFIELIRR
jgi:hypothetical protein